MNLQVSHLKHIGNDKEIGKDLSLLSHCKQPNDPGEAHHRDKDDGGLEQTPFGEVIQVYAIIHI